MSHPQSCYCVFRSRGGFAGKQEKIFFFIWDERIFWQMHETCTVSRGDRHVICERVFILPHIVHSTHHHDPCITQHVQPRLGKARLSLFLTAGPAALSRTVEAVAILSIGVSDDMWGHVRRWCKVKSLYPHLWSLAISSLWPAAALALTPELLPLSRLRLRGQSCRESGNLRTSELRVSKTSNRDTRGLFVFHRSPQFYGTNTRQVTHNAFLIN